MEMDPRAFIQQSYRYAVVGASAQREKYGNVVLRDLAKAGFDVVGVNPKHNKVEGFPCYATLMDIPEKPDVAVFVVPPSVGVHLLEDAHKAHVEKIWCQPGADSEDIRNEAQELGLQVMANNSCIMVMHRALGFEPHETT